MVSVLESGMRQGKDEGKWGGKAPRGREGGTREESRLKMLKCIHVKSVALSLTFSPSSFNFYGPETLKKPSVLAAAP